MPPWSRRGLRHSGASWGNSSVRSGNGSIRRRSAWRARAAADAGPAAGGDGAALRPQHDLVHLDRARAGCVGVADGAGEGGGDLAAGPGRAGVSVRPGWETRSLAPGSSDAGYVPASVQACVEAIQACRPMCWTAIGRRDAGTRRQSICSLAGWTSRASKTCCVSCFSSQRPEA